jgi:hypothetical protein
MGEGSLLEAIIDFALEKGHSLNILPVKNLLGVELNSKYYLNAIDKFKKKYNIDMSNCFYNCDILTFSDVKCDIIFGNPPWQNFVDLPYAYKKFIKPFFYKFNLVGNSKELLLGNSRIDIASLIIQKTIYDNLNSHGYAIFFIPLSILLNDGANNKFRLFSINDINYSLSSVYDFNSLDVFVDISTRYGVAKFDRNLSTNYPIPYYRYENSIWKEFFASPGTAPNGALCIHNDKNDKNIIPKIEVPVGSIPRQGINTCGANDIFIFNEYLSIDDDLCKLDNKHILPKKYIYPLITSKNFSDIPEPNKWVLLPYNQDLGIPLTLEELRKNNILYTYLCKFKEYLSKRKGTMLNAQIKRGIWWSLLGVGKYNFCKYKVVWEAYGKKKFLPRIFDGNWQANQSLQAFIPCKDKSTADKILNSLSDPLVEKYLSASKMEGTMNWAQPGKISKLLIFPDKQLSLLDN